MTFDELQGKWQAHKESATITVDSDMLLKEIKRNKKYFESVVYSRDIREAGVAIAMFLFFGYVGLQDNFWPLLLLALLVLFIAVFLIADRIVQKGPKHLNLSPAASRHLCMRSTIRYGS